MKKTLEKIRSKSPEVRMTIAFVLAVFFTGLVAAGWVMTLSSNKHPANKSNAPSPFNALTGTIKDIVASPENNTQIIDAGNPSATHDESNPYQNSVTPETTQGAAQTQ